MALWMVGHGCLGGAMTPQDALATSPAKTLVRRGRRGVKLSPGANARLASCVTSS